MKYGSIGIPAEWRSRRDDWWRRRRGFTLIEALVALALLLAFAVAFGPLMFQTRRLLLEGDGRVQAELFLHSLLQTPFNRLDPDASREGEEGGMHWRIDVTPAGDEFDGLEPSTPYDAAVVTKKDNDKTGPGKKKELKWRLFRVAAKVTWGAGHRVSAETLRLGKIDDEAGPR